MIGRASLMLAAALAWPAAAEVAAPVYRAPYEVVTGDPSCNGPDQSLYRIKLAVSDFAQELEAPNTQCYVTQRTGVETENVLVECPRVEGASNSSESDLRSPDALAFEGTVAICRDDWAYKISFEAGEVQGNLGGKPLNFGLETMTHQSQRWADIDLIKVDDPQRIAQVELGLKFDLWCWEAFRNSRYSASHTMHFVLAEHDLDTCTPEACFDQITDEDFHSNIRVAANCTDVEVGK